MALHQTTIGPKAMDLGRVLLIAAAVIVLLVLATAILGVQVAGPTYEIVPDPAGLSGLSF